MKREKLFKISFLKCLATLHAEVRKENDIVLINRKCQKVLLSCKQDDDTVDGILDEIEQAKNNLISLIK